MTSQGPASIPLPRHWPQHVGAAVVHVIGLARFALAHVHGSFALSPLERVRLRSRVDRLEGEVGRLRAEMRLEDARMARIEPRRRPHYRPPQRLEILALRAAWGWSSARTARRFLVAPPTIAEWLKALEGEAEGPRVALAAPVNRFPDFVRQMVRMLGAASPTMGRRRIADTLCRAGLHLSASTVRRVLRQPPGRVPAPAPVVEDASGASDLGRTVTARYPNHVWHADLTSMPTLGGFWVPWLPNAMLEHWPFGWHIAVVLDHFSRAVVCARAFASKPGAGDVCGLLDEAVVCAGEPPRHIVTDQGSQFQSDYLQWCERRGAEPRFGAVGNKGSIAIIERFMRTLKSEGLRRILVPLTARTMHRELSLLCRWYNAHRPHRAHGGATPAEMRDGRLPAQHVLGVETRPGHPLRGKLTERRGIQKVERAERLELVVGHLEGRAHLPIVEIRKAA